MTYRGACDCVTIETDGAPDGSAGFRGDCGAGGTWGGVLSKIFHFLFADCLTDPRLTGLLFAGHLGATNMALVLLSLSIGKGRSRHKVIKRFL